MLSWESRNNLSLPLVLQQATTADFRAPSATPVEASGSLTLTGFKDGLYYFRVGADGQWSAVQEVRVAHHSLSKALIWFAVGALLFVVLAITILSASRERAA